MIEILLLANLVISVGTLVVVMLDRRVDNHHQHEMIIPDIKTNRRL